MKTREFESREAAIKSARASGYWPVHTNDGRLVLGNGKRRYALAREDRARSTVFHLIEINNEGERIGHDVDTTAG